MIKIAFMKAEGSKIFRITLLTHSLHQMQMTGVNALKREKFIR